MIVIVDVVVGVDVSVDYAVVVVRMEERHRMDECYCICTVEFHKIIELQLAEHPTLREAENIEIFEKKLVITLERVCCSHLKRKFQHM